MDPRSHSLIHKIKRSFVQLNAPPLLVLLHGEGGDENEVFDLFQDADDRFVIVSLRAPFVQEGKKFLWFSTTRVQDDYLANPAQLEFSRQQIINSIYNISLKYHCDPDHVYLFGFGQGGIMSLNLLLTMPERIAGIALMNSQFLPEFQALLPAVERLRNKEILICHGKYNQIIPVYMGRKIKYELSTFPAAVDYQEFEIGHYYSKESITTVENWFSSLLDHAGVNELQFQKDYSVNLAAYQINVSDIDRSIHFYTRFLGMNLVERTGKAFAFLSNSQAHHVIELQLSDLKPDACQDSVPGYRSIQYEVPDQLSFAKVFWNLTQAGIQVTAADRIICWQMKFHDPDRNVIEIFWDTRHLPDRSDVWHGRELPLTQESILEILVKS